MIATGPISDAPGTGGQTATRKRSPFSGRARRACAAAVAVVCGAGALASAVSGDPVLVGTQKRVNPDVANDQGDPSAAMAADGTSAVAYSESSTTANDKVFVRRIDADGDPTGAVIPINDVDATNRSEPSLGMASDGRMVVAYRKGTVGSQDVMAQRLAADGTPQGGEIAVNVTTTDDQQFAQIAVAPDGRFVVVWRSAVGGSNTIQARTFAADGTPQQASDIPVNQSGTNPKAPDVAIDATGRFVVAWEYSITFGETGKIMARRFNADGTPQGSEFEAMTGTLNQPLTDAGVGLANDGRMVVVGFTGPAGGGTILAQRRASDNAADGGAVTVNNFCGCGVLFPVVAMDGDGDFIVAWHSLESGSQNVSLKQYDAAGVQQGAQVFPLIGGTSAPSPQPAIALDGTWRSAVAFTHADGGGQNGAGAFIRRLTYATAPSPSPSPPSPSPPSPSPTPTPTPMPTPTVVDPPAPDLVAARTPSCLSIPNVVRDQKVNVPGGKVFLVTRQLDDPAAPLRVSVKSSGAARIRSASFRVNRGRPQAAGPVSVALLRLGGNVQRNSVAATVVLTTGRRVVLTQYMIILKCSAPAAVCRRLPDGFSLRCTSGTSLGGRRVKVTASRTVGEVATGSATVTRGKYTVILRSRVRLSPGTYAYKHVVTTQIRTHRVFAIRRVQVS